MQNFNFLKTIFQGAYIIQNQFSEDNRGCFAKCYEEMTFLEHGIEFKVREEFYTKSHQNVVRGLHFQFNKPQGKIVNVVKGEIFDVILDLRKTSVTFGVWDTYVLTEKNHKSLLIPKGFAHGFFVLSGEAIVAYKCDSPYDISSDSGIVWNDNTLNINWPICDERKAIVSERDKNLFTYNSFCTKYGGIDG